MAALGCLLSAPAFAQRKLLPHPLVLAGASPELKERLRSDPFTYFRFINRAWTERVCEAFADLTNPTIVRLHGDAHVEQFALTKDAWGLADFDDSARGPAFIDIVRFLGSIDLASRERGWTRGRDKAWNRFFEGYRLGLYQPTFHPREPDLVLALRRQAPMTRAAYLAWGERLMQPMDEASTRNVAAGMDVLDRSVRVDRPDLSAGYFAVKRAGWLRMGVGSAGIRKVLIRVEGPAAGPDDDVLLEAKEVTSLVGVACLERPTTEPAVRVITGARQLARLRFDILAVVPTQLVPTADDSLPLLSWFVSSWEPSYREVRLSDLRSVKDLGDIAFDAGVQLGAGKLPVVRKPELSSVAALERRLRKETSTIVEELIAGWRLMAGR